MTQTDASTADAATEPPPNNDEDAVQMAKQAVSHLTQSTGRALGNLFMPVVQNVQNAAQRKYTLPDKTVASQVLMYRQLLHTKARTGLKLSRPYQATPAQQAVKDMPWWEEGMEETKKMVISYDNLIVRLWLHGAIMPFTDDLLGGGGMETLIDDKGLPPVPHKYWVERLGFQQEDPVTDFRSGGVLSLAMLVYMVESCPAVVERFRTDVAVLPFGITCINITDMMAKFLMLSKSVDKMDALLSQKPFWKMFGDPNAILALQELSMTMLCDVVVELGRERKIPGNLSASEHENRHGEADGNVTVFDFHLILDTTEKRVRDDLLGAGPKTVEEMRAIAARLHTKYQRALEEKERRAGQPPPPQLKEVAGQVVDGTATVAAGFFTKLKAASPNLKEFTKRRSSQNINSEDVATDGAAAAANTQAEIPDLLTANSSPDKNSAVVPDLLTPNPTTSPAAVPAEEGVLVDYSDAAMEEDVAASLAHFSIDDDDML